jgi:hypothetical protein
LKSVLRVSEERKHENRKDPQRDTVESDSFFEQAFEMLVSGSHQGLTVNPLSFTSSEKVDPWPGESLWFRFNNKHLLNFTGSPPFLY